MALTIDDIRVTLYKDRIKRRITISQQLDEIGVDKSCVRQLFYRTGHDYSPTWLRIVNKVIELKGGVKNDEDAK